MTARSASLFPPKVSEFSSAQAAQIFAGKRFLPAEISLNLPYNRYVTIKKHQSASPRVYSDAALIDDRPICRLQRVQQSQSEYSIRSSSQDRTETSNVVPRSGKAVTAAMIAIAMARARILYFMEISLITAHSSGGSDKPQTTHDFLKNI
jgi:hypothetical protein